MLSGRCFVERRRYSKEFIDSVLKDFKETGDVAD